MCDNISIKEEAENDDYEDVAVIELYANHEIKEELVIGPEVLQQSDAVDETNDKELSHNFFTKNIKYESESEIEENWESSTTETQLEENLIPCKNCHRIFPSKKSLSVHNSRFHRQKPFSCNVCSKKFFHKCHLNRHKQSHDDRKYLTFTCDICMKNFSQENRLESHMSIHTLEHPYVCDICEKTFSRRDGLVTHMYVHMQTKKFACHICKRRFLKTSNLYQHMRTHTNEKPFSCEVCNKKFSRKDSKYRHMMRFHSGEKPFECDACSKLFAHRSNLTTHMRYHEKVGLNIKNSNSKKQVKLVKVKLEQ